MLKYKVITSPVEPMYENALDAYMLAERENISVSEAQAVLELEKYQFVGYSDCGMPMYMYCEDEND